MPHRPLQTAFTRATGRGRSPHARLREDYPRQSGSEPLPDGVEDGVELELGVAFHLSELAVQLDDAENCSAGRALAPERGPESSMAKPRSSAIENPVCSW